ncbi:MAG: sulfatase [Bdellovibrionales bacterium]|nr:sulfatase [Bdellovibrionales bacterium]
MRFLVILFACLLLSGEIAIAAEKPNILLIVTDDQRYDDLDDFMPFTKETIFNAGLQFAKGYITTPACCPSRATILTGKYASEHKVTGNRYVLEQKTVVQRLHEAGEYFTGIIGKYLNTWPGDQRSEFDYWVTFAGGSTQYYNPTLNVNGTWQKTPGYITNLFRDYTLEFLDRATESNKPFFCYLAVNAPHSPTTPEQDDRRLFLNFPKSRPPSFAEGNRSDKPKWLRRIEPLSPHKIAQIDDFRLRQRQTLASVDRAIAAILQKLDDEGKLENTAIIFISDNGVMSGEHGLTSKDTVYEEAIHVPFAIRYPGVIESGVSDALVANIDIAPTVYELAGLPVPGDVSGTSLLQLHSPELEWRKELLIEGFRAKGPRTPFSAVHTGDFVYVENADKYPGFDVNRTELYDLKADPYQLTNVTHSKEYLEIKKDLHSRLDALLDAHRGYRNLSRPDGTKLSYRPEPPELGRSSKK